MYSIEQINEAIANGTPVTGTHSDLRRPGQPNPGQDLRITRAHQTLFDGRIRVSAAGHKGRFAAANVLIEGLVYDTTPDTY